MAELKTRKSDDSVDDFIASIEDERKREDSRALLSMMRRVTGEEPKMWGSSIVGFGDMHYAYATGRQGEWFKVGFSPRKQNLTVYAMQYIASDDPLLARLGKYTTGKSCLYIKRLSDVDETVLESLIRRSFEGLA